MNIWRKVFSNLFIKCAQCEKKAFISRTTLVTWDGECRFKDCEIQFTLCHNCSIYTRSNSYVMNDFYDKIKENHRVDYHTQVDLV